MNLARSYICIIYIHIYIYISVNNEQNDGLSNLEAFSACEDWAPVAGDLNEGKYDTAACV